MKKVKPFLILFPTLFVIGDLKGWKAFTNFSSIHHVALFAFFRFFLSFFTLEFWFKNFFHLKTLAIIRLIIAKFDIWNARTFHCFWMRYEILANYHKHELMKWKRRKFINRYGVFVSEVITCLISFFSAFLFRKVWVFSWWQHLIWFTFFIKKFIFSTLNIIWQIDC